MKILCPYVIPHHMGGLVSSCDGYDYDSNEKRCSWLGGEGECTHERERCNLPRVAPLVLRQCGEDCLYYPDETSDDDACRKTGTVLLRILLDRDFGDYEIDNTFSGRFPDDCPLPGAEGV